MIIEIVLGGKEKQKGHYFFGHVQLLLLLGYNICRSLIRKVSVSNPVFRSAQER